MLEVLEFVLGTPWHFIGTLILIFAIGLMIEEIVCHCRSQKVYQTFYTCEKCKDCDECDKCLKRKE